jgi:hypothetical protein
MEIKSWVSAAKPFIVHQNSMQSFQEFINKISEKEGHRMSAEIDAMIEAALKQSICGRVIVWLVVKKCFRLAAFASRLARFSLEMQPELISGDRIYRVKLRGRVIGTKTIHVLDRIRTLS